MWINTLTSLLSIFLTACHTLPMRTLFIILLFVVAGCAHAPKSKLSKSVTNSPVRAPSEKFSTTQSRRDLQDLKQTQKDRMAILNAKSRMNPESMPEIGAQARVVSSGKVGIDYEELLASYERNDNKAFAPLYKKFLSQWGRSDYADDAVYLKGMMELSQKNYGSALMAFNRVLKEYPNGNRAEASQFAKAATLKRMNLKPLAVGAYKDLTEKYPGSPEALRARDEVKLLR